MPRRTCVALPVLAWWASAPLWPQSSSEGLVPPPTPLRSASAGALLPLATERTPPPPPLRARMSAQVAIEVKVPVPSLSRQVSEPSAAPTSRSRSPSPSRSPSAGTLLFRLVAASTSDGSRPNLGALALPMLAKSATSPFLAPTRRSGLPSPVTSPTAGEASPLATCSCASGDRPSGTALKVPLSRRMRLRVPSASPMMLRASEGKRRERRG